MARGDAVHWVNLLSDIKGLYPRIIQPKLSYIICHTFCVNLRDLDRPLIFE